MAMSPAEPKWPARRVLFLADCGPRAGGGHVMRCLSLAGALLDRGAACAMAATPSTTQVLDAFADQRLDRLEVPQAPPEELVERVRTAGEAWRADLVAVDHYRLEARHERGLGVPVAVIDDLADRPHDCRLLVDPGLGRSAGDYAALVPPGACVMTGPGHALLAPAYAAARPAALAARRAGARPRRLLVSLGLMDLGGITGKVLGLLRPSLGDLQIDVVVGGQAPTLPALMALAADGRFRLHVDSREMAALIAAADIGVGAGGSSTWERAALGLPSISLVLADNQAGLTQELDRLGACLAVDARGGAVGVALAEAFDNLLADGAVRRRLSDTSAALCDGGGATRVAEAILELAL